MCIIYIYIYIHNYTYRFVAVDLSSFIFKRFFAAVSCWNPGGLCDL